MSDFFASIAKASATFNRKASAKIADNASEGARLGIAIGRAESESVMAGKLSEAAKAQAKDMSARNGAYVALGKAIFAAMIAQKPFDGIIGTARDSASAELTRLGITGEDHAKRMASVNKGISRAKVSANERLTGKTAKGDKITAQTCETVDGFDSVETESDRKGRKNAEERNAGKDAKQERRASPDRKIMEGRRAVLGSWKAYSAAREGTAAKANATQALEMALAAWVTLEQFDDEPNH